MPKQEFDVNDLSSVVTLSLNFKKHLWLVFVNYRLSVWRQLLQQQKQQKAVCSDALQAESSAIGQITELRQNYTIDFN